MKVPLFITGCGAVTAAGLTAPQTCAAFRANLSAFELIILSEPFGHEQIVARIPAHWRLRRTEGEWLINMAARVVKETLAHSGAELSETAIFLALPEGFRKHPCFESIAPPAFLPSLLGRLGQPVHPSSRIIDGGAAALVGEIERASKLIAEKIVQQVVLVGVDSLINPVDLSRLLAANRWLGEDNAQGLIPGEGAAAVMLSGMPPQGNSTAAVIRSIGVALERNSVLGTAYSDGSGMQGALIKAVSDPGCSESAVDYIVSNANGERYAGIEALVFRSRFYRTHRDYMATKYPAMTVGETGSAAASLALITAADGIRKGYAPGKTVMCELSSEAGLRTAVYMQALVR
jgi:3-oxoacyl-[acyl-carrier-protein] synthase-1